MPLHEIPAAHECAMFCRSSIVVPKIEENEIDGIFKWFSLEHPVLAQTVHKRLRGFHAVVCKIHDLLRLGIYLFDHGARVALAADGLHIGFRRRGIRARLRNRVGKIRRQPFGGIVGQLQSVQSAHVAGRAGGDKHIARRKNTGGCIQVQGSLLRGEYDAVLGLPVDFNLRMIWSHMALPARGWQARDSNRTCVPGMARGAVADGAVLIGTANGMALFAPALNCIASF